MGSRSFSPFAPLDGGSRRHDPGAVDVAPDDLSLFGSRRHRPRSAEDLAAYGYAGQGYPLYGRPRPTADEREHDDDRRARERSASWLADPSSSAFAFGYTTSLGVAGSAPSGRGRGNAGKGPKDYLRADSRVHEDVCDRLSDDDEVDASDISVEVRGGEVTLRGTVPDRFTKRRAEAIAASVRGVIDVRNDLRAHKGLLRELGDQLAGDAEHRGHHGEGPR